MKKGDIIKVTFTKNTSLVVYPKSDKRYKEGCEEMFLEGQTLEFEILKIEDEGETIEVKFLSDLYSIHYTGDRTFLFPPGFKNNDTDRRRQHFKII